LKANQDAQRDKLRHLNSVALATIEIVMLDELSPHRDKLTAAFKVLEITKFSQGNIGSSNPSTLQERFNEAKILDTFSF